MPATPGMPAAPGMPAVPGMPGEEPGEEVQQTPYCCKGAMDTSEPCDTGYRVNRQCMAEMLDDKGFGDDVNASATKFAESTKPTYCCQVGDCSAADSINVPVADWKGAPKEGKAGQDVV